MDFALSSDQDLIKQSVRRFLENECPKDKVRELLQDEKGYDPDMWRKMVDLGWMGLMLPEAYGGMELGFVDMAIVLEEMGRFIFFMKMVKNTLMKKYPWHSLISNG